jgi:tetratricopeptide (TPR) repeat protein
MGTRRKTATDAGSWPLERLRGQSDGAHGAAELPLPYIEACRLAEEGRFQEAREAYARLLRLRRRAKKDARLRGLIHNDLAVLDAFEGKFDEAREEWRRAVEADGGLLLARLNRDLLAAEAAMGEVEELEQLKLVPQPGDSAGGAVRVLVPHPPQPSPIEREGDLSTASAELVNSSGVANPADLRSEAGHHAEPDDYYGSARVSDPAVGPTARLRPPNARNTDSPTRIAILSFLFNWPSTGGGNMHTAGLVEFLGRSGYEVRHFFTRFLAWGIGRVAGEGLAASEALDFDEASWNVGEIQRQYRRAVDEFQPHFVAITDAWNMKPHLGESL